MHARWGKSVAIDLYSCPHERVSDRQILVDYVAQVLTVIKMKAHGPTYVDRFGDPALQLEGYSAMQFIETSSITVHLDEIGNRAFVDIFSCQDFDAKAAAEFTRDYFQAKEMKYTPLDR